MSCYGHYHSENGNEDNVGLMVIVLGCDLLTLTHSLCLLFITFICFTLCVPHLSKWLRQIQYVASGRGISSEKQNSGHTQMLKQFQDVVYHFFNLLLTSRAGNLKIKKTSIILLMHKCRTGSWFCFVTNSSSSSWILVLYILNAP